MRVYIASPYTKPEGQQLENVYKSFEVFHQLMKLDIIPFCPLTSHFIYEKFPMTHQQWIEYDLEWVKVCDCILRLDGDSIGADIETEYARFKGIPVFYSIDEVLEYKKRNNYV